MSDRLGLLLLARLVFTAWDGAEGEVGQSLNLSSCCGCQTGASLARLVHRVFYLFAQGFLPSLHREGGLWRGACHLKGKGNVC